MSDTPEQPDDDLYTNPSSDNRSTRDYGTEDGYDILYPEEEKVEPHYIQSPDARSPPIKRRLKLRIKNIIGESSDEYLDYITDSMYNYKYLDMRYPDNLKEIIEYLNKRLEI